MVTEKTDGYRELLLGLIIDAQREARDDSRWNREQLTEIRVLLTSINSSIGSQKVAPDPAMGWLLRLWEMVPTFREAIIWLIPRAIIFWGMLEGWWAMGWHWLRIILLGH